MLSAPCAVAFLKNFLDFLKFCSLRDKNQVLVITQSRSEKGGSPVAWIEAFRNAARLRQVSGAPSAKRSELVR